MATTVSHEMRRYPTTQSEASYSAYNALRNENPSQWSSSSRGADGGSALSRSMRYAEPWLYGSVRAAPGTLVLAYPAPAAIVLCSCADYASGTKRSKKSPGQCKKCKGARLPLAGAQQGTVRAKYGTVRGYPTAAQAVVPAARAGTVRVSASSRPSILPAGPPSVLPAALPSVLPAVLPPVDPYDLMRRSRLTCPDTSSQFRARSTSPGRSRGHSAPRSKNRSPSPANGFPSRRSILECEVNPYDLMTKSEQPPKPAKHDDYEDVELPRKSQIPKLQAKKRSAVEREREDAKYKGILKKPAGADAGHAVESVLSTTPKSSHFYLPLPNSPRKKVQFRVEGEGKAAPEVAREVVEPPRQTKVLDEKEQSLSDDDQEPCRLKRSLSERLGQGASAVVFHDTMALRTRTARPDTRIAHFGSLNDLQKLDGMCPTKPRPKEPPPPPPAEEDEVTERPPTPPPRSVTELEVTTICEVKIDRENEQKSINDSAEEPANEKPKEDTKTMKQESKDKEVTEEILTPPSAPPRKRSTGRQPNGNKTKNRETRKQASPEPIKEESIPPKPESQIDPIKERMLKEADENLDKIISESCRDESPKLTVKFTTNSTYPTNIPEAISPTVRIEPSKTIVQINSPWTSPSVHRLQIRNEFESVNMNSLPFTEPQRKTSIMINGDECYSTVNVNDDVPIYQSSVVVNDYDCNKVEVISGTRSSVYITGDFQTQNDKIVKDIQEDRSKKTFVILESKPSPEIEKSKTLVLLQSNDEKEVEPVKVEESNVELSKRELPEIPKQKETVANAERPRRKQNNNRVRRDSLEGDAPSPDEIQRLLKDPVEAVKHNLVPHVCGKADVERKPKNQKSSYSSNTLVARLLEDPFLGSLAEGLETDTVAKLIQDSLLKLRQDSQEEEKDESENDSCPAYELMDHGSDCYSNHSNRSSVTEEELGTRSKFYQLLADASLSEVEDHHYEIIRQNVDPIYEEIEIPPPLPSNPPPQVVVDDLQIDKQFTTRSIFEGASKYDILSYLVDAKERGIVPEESYTYNFNNSGEVIVEEEERAKSEAFSSRISHMSTVSDSSEDSSLVISGPQKPAEVERNDSGVGSETSKCSRSRYLNQPETSMICEDCDLVIDPPPEDNGPLVCRKCSKKRTERKEIITEIVETEEKYGRDLQIILEEFYQPMLVAGLLTPDQLSAIFLNVEELLENSQALAERLRDTLDIAVEQGDEDLLTVNIGKIFIEAAPMLHAFESYCVRQGPASLLLAGLEKDKELLRIFLRVSQMENTMLRRMNLNSFLMVPVQRVTKYPLLLARLHKVTPLHHESREQLRESQHKIELHLSHMNSETRDVPSKLWRRISSGSGRRSSSEMDLVNIKLRKIAVDVLEWNHDEARFALEGRLLYTQPTDNNWRKGRTIKLTPVNALLVTNGKPGSSGRPDRTDEGGLAFPRHTGIREAALLLVRDKGGRYSLLREPLYLDRCVIATDPAWQNYFEVQELLGKDTFIFKAEDPEMTRTWYRQLQYHAQGMGQWRKRRNALANIMISGMGSRS